MSSDGPDLTDSLLDMLPDSLGKPLKSFFGWMGNHKATEAATAAGAFDLAVGDGMLGSAEGAGAAALFQKEGLPPLFAALGGALVGKFGANSMIEGALAFGAIWVGIKLAQKFFGLGQDGPAPSPAPAH